MAAMNREQLLDYIKTAIGLETDIVIQQDVIRQYDENSLARKPEIQLVKTPTKPEPPIPRSIDLHYDRSYVYKLITGIGFIIMGITIAVSCADESILNRGSLMIWAIGLILAGTAICVLPFILGKMNNKKENQKDLDLYQKQLDSYDNSLRQINEMNVRISDTYRANLQAWQTSDTDNRAVLTDHLTETQSILDKLYDLDYIYPKYRTLPALTSIYEYLVTGRCEELSGPHGAYNLYEDEVRKDTVISQLNTVIANLEQIKQNQYMLYQQVKAIQKNTSVIAAEITQIRGYTAAITQLSALNAYYSALTARNTGITAAYNLLN